MIALHPEVLVVAAYGLILPASLLNAARHGALNVHASLLPRWRGAAPIQRALLAGDEKTGISIMQMDEGLDTGPVYAQSEIAIERQDDAGTLHDKLARLGGRMILQTLVDIEEGHARAVPQPRAGVTYAPKIEKKEAMLDWSRPAVELERAVRAYRPAPGASTVLEGKPIKVWEAHAVEDCLPSGAWIAKDGHLIVGSGDGALAIAELQRAGGKRMLAEPFMRGCSLPRGVRFG